MPALRLVGAAPRFGATVPQPFLRGPGRHRRSPSRRTAPRCQIKNSSALTASLVGLYASTVTLQMLDVRSTILAAHQLAKHNTVAAVVTLVALNSAYASVVAHNFDLARQMRSGAFPEA